MKAGEEHHGKDPANERKKHVGLSVPWIALCSQELIGALSEHNSSPPLNKLVGCTDCQDNTNGEEGEHSFTTDILPSNEYLPSNKCGNKPLEEMTNLIVGIPAEVQQICEMKPQRYSGIGV